MTIDPAAVWERGVVKRTLNDVADAAEFLEDTWPEASRGTYFHSLALQLAREALEGTTDAELFRRVFVTAAKEAGIFAPPQERSGIALPGHIARPWTRRRKR
jgi:hypothetical protein